MSLFSIIIPTYNREVLIGETLTSVLNQTYSNWECIVVDDGSDDKTCDVVKEYIDNDKRFKLINRNRKPKGASTCRNIGIENSKGEFVFFLDSDDLITETCLSYRMSKIEQYPNNSAWIFNTGIFNKIIGDSNFIWNKFEAGNDDVIRFLNQDMPWSVEGPIWDVKEILKFNENAKSFQDWEYHMRFLATDKPYFKDVENRLTVFYRRDEVNKSISSNTFEHEQLINRIEIIIETLKIVNSKTNKYDFDTVKLIFRSVRLLKTQGLKSESLYYWDLCKIHFQFSKIDLKILTIFLHFLNSKNEKYLEFIVFRILKKGYLLNFNSTFLSCIK